MFSKYLDIFGLLIIGMLIIYEKGNSIKGHYTYYGNWSFLIGGIFIFLGIYFALRVFKDKE